MIDKFKRNSIPSAREGPTVRNIEYHLIKLSLSQLILLSRKNGVSIGTS
jgi:hypothetical protein